MAETADWLYQVGVDTTKADAGVREFVQRTNGLLASIRNLTLTTSAQLGSANKVLESASKRLRIEQQIANTQTKGMVNEARGEANLLAAQAKRLSAEQRIAALQSRANSATGIPNIANTAEENAAAVEHQTQALNLLSRIAGNAVFKFVEYEVVMNSFNAVIHEFTNSLNQAGDVQMEQTLQRLYGAQINVNEALKNATIIAEQWGGNIVDIQQAIGLWTKQTKDLGAATFLAAKAEEMARASGVQTLEVYRMSVAIASQMGIELNKLPAVYDSISYAALKLAEPLRAIGVSGKEGMKDLLDGLAQASATLGSVFQKDPNAVIAVVAAQITALGEGGKEAAKNLSSMFAMIDGKNPYAGNYEAILGKSAFQSTDKLLQ